MQIIPNLLKCAWLRCTLSLRNVITSTCWRAVRWETALKWQHFWWDCFYCMQRRKMLNRILGHDEETQWDTDKQYSGYAPCLFAWYILKLKPVKWNISECLNKSVRQAKLLRCDVQFFICVCVNRHLPRLSHAACSWYFTAAGRHSTCIQPKTNFK